MNTKGWRRSVLPRLASCHVIPVLGFVALFVCLSVMAGSGGEWLMLSARSLLPVYDGNRTFQIVDIDHFRIEWSDFNKTMGANRTQPGARLVLYNRIDKAGSSTLITLLKKCSKKKHTFQLLNSKQYWNRFLNDTDQEILVNHLGKISQDQLWLFERHVNFIDFRGFNASQPIYINQVRDPVERFISAFFFFRLPKRWKRKNNSTNSTNSSVPYRPSRTWLQKNLTECVMNGDPECAMKSFHRHRGPYGDEFFEPMVSYFCGHEPVCRDGGSLPALQKSLSNLEKHYSVVCVLEYLQLSLHVLEAYVPKFFRNVSALYWEGEVSNRNWARPPTPAAVAEELRRRLAADQLLYAFARQKLFLQFRRARRTVPPSREPE